MKNENTNTQEHIPNTNVYLSQDILDVSQALMSTSHTYHYAIKIFIYIMNTYRLSNSMGNDYEISINQSKLEEILGFKKGYIYYPQAKKILMDFKQYMNDEKTLKKLKCTEPFFVKGTVYDPYKTVSLVINGSNPIVQAITAKSKKFVTFKFGAISKQFDKYSIFMFLILASRNKLHKVRYLTDNWKKQFNISPKTTTTRLKAYMNKAVAPLSEYFMNVEVHLIRKSAHTSSAIAITWTQYDSKTGAAPRHTSINNNKTSYINFDETNEFTKNWNPDYSSDYLTFLTSVTQYVQKFCKKHNTHISNLRELCEAMIKSYDDVDNISDDDFDDQDPFGFDK